MRYKELKLRANTPESASTEIMYEIASSRQEDVSLIRFNISYEADDESSTEFKRLFSSVIKLLKSMKQKGSIQFFATSDSFKLATTEAVFLQNKYPDVFPVKENIEGNAFIFVKI